MEFTLCKSFCLRSEHFSPPVQIKVHDGDAVYFGGVGVRISPVYSSAIATTIGNVGLLFFSPLKALRARGSLSGFTRFLTFLCKAWLTGPFIDSPHVGRLWVVSRMRGGAAKCTMFFRHQQGRFSLNWDWLILAWACSDKLSTHLPSPRAQALALS